METNIRKVGNSAGTIFPSSILKDLELSIGDAIDISINEGNILIKPCHKKKKYSLDELLSQCDANAPYPSGLLEWDNLEPVGNESL